MEQALFWEEREFINMGGRSLLQQLFPASPYVVLS